MCYIIVTRSYNNIVPYKRTKHLYKKAVLDGIAGNKLEKKT